MKTLRELQKKTDDTIAMWGYQEQREYFDAISSGTWYIKWSDVYEKIEKIDDPEIKEFSEKCKSIDLNKLSNQDVKDLTTLVWASIMTDGIEL